MKCNRQRVRHQSFALDINGRAVLAFSARGLAHARQTCSEGWFIDELISCRSNGRSIWDRTAEIRVRRANPAERTELQIASTIERARREYEGHVFVFFVPVDDCLH